MKIVDALETDIPFCHPDESAQDAAERMWHWGYESLPVCEAGRRLIGSISLRTACLRAYFTGKRLSNIQAREATAHETLVCRLDDPIRDVVELMTRTRLWHVPVVDDAHRLLGVVSYANLQRWIQSARDLIRVLPQTEGKESAPDMPAHFPGWTLLVSQRELISAAHIRVHLSRAELKLLMVLLERAGQVVSREVLMREVCNRGWDPSDRYIDVLIGNLRKKFGERAADANILRTVHNDGYLFTPKVAGELPGGADASSGNALRVRLPPQYVSGAARSQRA